jgi:hypothetical protein
MENQENRRHWGRFFIFTGIVGSIVGVFSVISDNLTYLADDVTALEIVISYLAVMINSLPMWFILAMLVGFIFARSIKEAVLLGAIYTTTAITFYFLIGYFYMDAAVPISLKAKAVVYANWYGASVIGGFIGGAVGILFKKTPYALLVLLVGLILQLFLNGTFSWGTLSVLHKMLLFV